MEGGGGDSLLLLETKEQRMNYLIDLLSTKAQDMYIQGEGLNFVYASVWLAARIHAQRKPLAGTTMLPCWFRRVLQTLRDNNKSRKQRPWALAPTIGSASADGQHFMPLCDSDDYHEQDAMLSDSRELHLARCDFGVWSISTLLVNACVAFIKPVRITKIALIAHPIRLCC